MASSWDRQITDTEEALAKDDYNDAIRQSTKALDNLFLQASTMVRVRSRAWGRKGDLSKQIKDATLALEWTPRDAEAYLHCGRLYAAQGNQQKAMDVFEKGLSIVSSSSSSSSRENDNDNEILSNTFKAEIYEAKARLFQRIDFFAKCPYDIFTNVVKLLPVDALNECASVNRAWRSKILSCPSAWREFNFDDNFYDTYQQDEPPIESLASLLPQVTQHVEDLTLRTNTTFIAKMVQLMREKRFSSLRTLNVWGPGIMKCTFFFFEYVALDERKLKYDLSFFYLVYTVVEDQDTPKDFTYDKIANILPNISGTLKELTLMLWNHNGPSLALILSVCRNLTHVTFSSPDPRALLGLSLSFSTNLVSLEIRAESNEFPESELDNLFQRSPHLRCMRLDGCQFDIIPHLNRASIHLVALLIHPLEFQYGASPDAYLTDDDYPNKEGREAPPKHGILRYFQSGGIMSAESLKQLLTENHNTLEKLGLASHQDITAEDHDGLSQPTLTDSWQTLGQLPIFNKLHALALNSTHNHDTDFYDKVPDILRSCPNITSLTLHEFNERPLPHNLFAPAADMKSLTFLELFSMDLESPPLIELLQKLVIHGTRSTIDTLQIDGCYGRAGDAMLLISKLNNLQELSFGDDLDEHSTSICAEQFARNLARLPKLQMLDVTDVNFSNEALQLLCESKSLEYVTLNGTNGISIETLARFLQHDPPIHLSYS
ncbi:hypothetical protein BDA99DRAFT_511398 [Phascolomyces articulosus]|uniref:F-box domain-containing protein n=1 Tax=Phascolomyces articulosus TaxID=60185 RepID=A0AAD5K8G6_9FUNG|nr:hypothetical protein BDA99DRAFT_511398 [Phascolomyces articulosus]